MCLLPGRPRGGPGRSPDLPANSARAYSPASLSSTWSPTTRTTSGARSRGLLPRRHAARIRASRSRSAVNVLGRPRSLFDLA
jgi:hypothetical protein